MDKLRTIFVAAMICLVVSTTSAYAFLLYSNSVMRDVLPRELFLTVDPVSAIYEGDSFTLTATLTPAQEGKAVSFYQNNILIDTVNTDSSGVASLVFSPEAVGSYTFNATALVP